MARRLITAALAAGLGALAALGAVLVAPAAGAGVAFEMDRDVPVATTGVYPAERDGDATWVWTAPRASLTIANADRFVPWTCQLRLRAGRPPGEPVPTVSVTIDGAGRVSREVGAEFLDLTVGAPPRADRRGLLLGIDTSETFRPAGDPRDLGVLVDRIACQPESVAAPPAGVRAAAAGAAAVLGAGVALAGAPALVAIGTAMGVGALQVLPLTTNGAAFTAYAGLLPRTAFWLALGLIAAALVARAVARAPLTTAAHAVIAGSAAVVYLKLLGLLHPAKPIVDAVYHAHRLDRVLNGQFYFTQIMPNGVEFPYAVALYVVAAPWTWLTTDHVAVLRIVTTVAEALTGALLYVVAVRVRGDRRLGLAAVALFHAVPIAYPVIGNANLTNAFGQAAALAAMAAAVAWPPATAATMAFAAGLISVALLSHVSTAGLTAVTVGALAVAYWWLGGSALRPAGRRLLLALLVAGLASVVLYWGHFGDTYRTLASVRAEATAAPGDAAESASPLESDARTLPERIGTALRLARVDLGWPLILLAALGAARLLAAGPLDRLSMAMIAWGVAYACFFAVGVLAPVSGGYERYAAEFIGRVDLATYPAVVLLGAGAVAWLWSLGAAGRVAAVAAVVWVAAAGAFAEWRVWIL